jgi:hypothetical protein
MGKDSKMRSEEELNEIAIEVLSKVLDDNKRLGIQMIKHMNSNSTPDEVMSTIDELRVEFRRKLDSYALNKSEMEIVLKSSMSDKSLKDDRVVSRILNILKTGVLD